MKGVWQPSIFLWHDPNVGRSDKCGPLFSKAEGRLTGTYAVSGGILERRGVDSYSGASDRKTALICPLFQQTLNECLL